MDPACTPTSIANVAGSADRHESALERRNHSSGACRFYPDTDHRNGYTNNAIRVGLPEAAVNRTRNALLLGLQAEDPDGRSTTQTWHTLYPVALRERRRARQRELHIDTEGTLRVERALIQPPKGLLHLIGANHLTCYIPAPE